MKDRKDIINEQGLVQDRYIREGIRTLAANIGTTVLDFKEAGQCHCDSGVTVLHNLGSGIDVAPPPLFVVVPNNQLWPKVKITPTVQHCVSPISMPS